MLQPAWEPRNPAGIPRARASDTTSDEVGMPEQSRPHSLINSSIVVGSSIRDPPPTRWVCAKTLRALFRMCSGVWKAGTDQADVRLRGRRYNRTSEFSKSFTLGGFLPLPGAIECPSSFNRCSCVFIPPGNFSFKLPSSLITRQ